MTITGELRVVPWRAENPRDRDQLAALLAAYHLQTETEKGNPVADVDALPDRYRTEITHPQDAFAADTVLTALSGDAAAGCLVITTPPEGAVEIKRLWTDPTYRGRGVASALLDAALAHASRTDAAVIRLSVWAWRSGAIALYERFGFTMTESWEERDQLVCMTRAV